MVSFFELMELGITEVIPYVDAKDEEDHDFPVLPKIHNNGPSNISVHELLECPVCTNSMYPPIHQVRTLEIYYFYGFSFTFVSGFCCFGLFCCSHMKSM